MTILCNIKGNSHYSNNTSKKLINGGFIPKQLKLCYTYGGGDIIKDFLLFLLKFDKNYPPFAHQHHTPPPPLGIVDTF